MRLDELRCNLSWLEGITRSQKPRQRGLGLTANSPTIGLIKSTHRDKGGKGGTRASTNPGIRRLRGVQAHHESKEFLELV